MIADSFIQFMGYREDEDASQRVRPHSILVFAVEGKKTSAQVESILINLGRLRRRWSS